MLHHFITRRVRLVLTAGALGLAAVGSVSAQTTIGFEGGTPFASSGGVTIGRVGDTGVQDPSYGLSPTEGSQFALLTTFSDGGGAYPAGSPLFGGAGSVAVATLWGALFPGSSSNLLASNLNLVSGSAITLTLSLNAGDSVSFNWNFLTSEQFGTGSLDSAFVGVRQGTTGNPATFVALGGVSAGLLNTPGSVPHFDYMTGTQTYNFSAPSAGSYTFAIGVGDAAAEGIQSGLFVDNFRVIPVPEPGTVALCAVAGLGAITFRRRRSPR